MRILAVGAHPDDIELLCAGTLVKMKKRGDEIFMAHLCSGDKGHYEIKPAELTRIRKKEAEKSASIIGAEIDGGFFGDFEIFNSPDARKKVTDLIRRTRPDVIITHFPDDYMMDHSTTSRLVIDASFAATTPNYVTRYEFIPHMPLIIFMDSLAGLNFSPTEYVDISDVIDIKVKMLLCHQSQYKWLKEHDGIDYVEFMKTLASFRGQQCGVKYAEAFRTYRVWGRVVPRRVLP